MAHKVNGASLGPIYERLNDVNNYHPLDAETFADWSMEAGDIVTVSRDGKEYSSPVHTSTMTWRGRTPVVAINASGKQRRDPPAKVARQKFARSGAGMRTIQGIYYEMTSEDGILNSSILMTSSILRTEFNNSISDVHSFIEETADHIRSDVYASSSQIYSSIQQTASNLRVEFGNAVSDLHTVIETTAEGVRSDVYASSSQLYSSIQQTASNLRVEIGNAVSGLNSVIETTAEGVRTELNNAISDVHTVISETAEGIRSDVYASSSQIYSHIQQTASNFRVELGNAVSDLHAVIEATADGVRSDVYASSSQVYSSIQQTASNIRSEVRNSISNVYTVIEQTAENIILEVKKGARVFHQYSDPSFTEEVKNGDIWVKDSGASTHGRAEAFTYGDLESFRYADFFGQEIYVRKNGEWVGPIGGSQAENISRARIEETEDHIAIITDNMGGDYAEFIVEMGRIHSRVEDVEVGLQSTIEQTASMIRSAVFTANSTMYSEIIQTQSMIKSEVYNSESKVYSEIKQTANNISLVVSHKRAQYIQLEDPSLTHTMYDGDLWIVHKGNIYTHAAMSTLTHASLGNVQYLDYMGKVTKVWKGGEWLPYYDERAQHVDETRVDINENGIYLLKGDLSEQYSRFMVEREQIRSIVQDKIEGVGTQITQTAREIRSEAYASSSKIYTSIVQTASNIRIELRNAVSNIHTEIEASAGVVRSAVYASSSKVYSEIMQTVSSIESRVGYVEGFESLISQQATAIALVVQGTGSNARIKPAQIVAAINDGASSVMIDANRIRLGESDSSSVFSGLATGIQCNKAFTANKGLYIINTAQTYGVDARRLMHTASVSGNTLYIYDVDGNEVVNFSKATTIEPTWGGSGNRVLTWSAKQTNGGVTTTVDSKTLGFGGSHGAHNVELVVDANGDATRYSATHIDVPVYVGNTNGGSAQPTHRYEKTIRYSIASLLQEKTATNLDDVTPDDGYIGLKKVSIGINPTVSGSFSGSVLTVRPKVGTQNFGTNKFDLGFGGNVGAHNIELMVTTNGSPTRNGTAGISVPVRVARNNGPNVAPTAVYDKALTWSSILQIKSVAPTENMDVTPGSTFIGLAKVSIDVSAAYNAGYDANHSLFIGDYDGVAKPSSIPLSAGESVEVWPYFLKKDGTTYQWGPKYTFTAAAAPTPYINNNGSYIWTSSSIPSGATELPRLVSQFNLAKADGDNLIIKVQAGTKTHVYYCTP